jgi:restriction endonuclease S subunit
MDHLIELSKICEINAGLVLKRKEARESNGSLNMYKAITLKSFEDDAWINNDYLDKYYSIEQLDDKYLTKEHDVIIRLSYPYTAIHITKAFEGIVVPSLFAIIKTKEDQLDPGYLSFVLNSDAIKQTYYRNAMGSTVPVIRMQTIKDTEVPLLPLTKQQTISKLYELMIKEKRLHQLMTSNKEKYNKEITKRILMGGNNNAK